MASNINIIADEAVVDSSSPARSISAVSWAAIVAGAIVALATTAILLALGSGLGLASVSAWPGAGASATAFTIGAGLWLIVTQWLASAFGGYITGRLRVRWVNVHTHEVFFRDTAHGLLTWSLATVIGLVLIAGAVQSRQSAARAPGPRAEAADATGPSAYAVDTLFRGARAEDAASATRDRSEAAVILAADTAKKVFPEGDRDYLATLVTDRTGLASADAHARVDEAIVQIRNDAEAARKATSGFLIFTALSMVIGALIACVAAALGGQQRDEHP